MKLIDLFRMSSSNLFKRKIRTILTVLGVVIGTASIVVMISLGLGLDRATMEQIESYGGLTTIRVSEAYEDSSNNSSNGEKKRLNDALTEELKRLDHVESVTPFLNTSVILKQGIYEANVQLQGISLDGLREMNLEFAEGGVPEADAPLELVYGSALAEDFYNAKTGQYLYWETNTLPDVDFVGQPMFVIFDTDAYLSAKNNQNSAGAENTSTGMSNTDQTTKPVKMPKKYIIEGAGVIQKPASGYNQNSWSVYCDIDKLKQKLEKIYKNKPVPGQPLRKNGKPYREWFYSSINVSIESLDYMKDAQQAIKDMGYQAESNAEWIESTQEQSKTIQLVLGGIGAVSLFVAAIGIANTMMMSIYERTKEIGVIKVLGCSLGNIRTMFLMEAAGIGLIGGFVGIVLSYAISAIINSITTNMDSYGMAVSYIPPWLALLGLLFSVGVGMISGFFPALRAMHLSPLAAIRTE